MGMFDAIAKKKKQIEQVAATANSAQKPAAKTAKPASTSGLTGMAEGMAMGAIGGMIARKTGGGMRGGGQQQSSQGLVQQGATPGGAAQGIPDAASAIKLAEDKANALYGPEIGSQEPFSAKLDGNVWTVTGTAGFEAKISKADGKIISIKE